MEDAIAIVVLIALVVGIIAIGCAIGRSLELYRTCTDNGYKNATVQFGTRYCVTDDEPPVFVPLDGIIEGKEE